MRKTNRVLSLILAVAMVIGLVPMMTVSSSAAFNDTTLKFDENGEFTIIQLTDVQDDAEVEETTLATITKAMDRYNPDLVVLTGDNIAGKMNESDFKSSVNQFMAPIINKGVRYAVTFGNHDSEDSTLINTPSRDEQYDYYMSLSSLAVDMDEDSLSGTGTGAIPVYSYDEKHVQFAVYLADSGDYDANGDYDHVKADQIAWYESEAQRLAGLSATGERVPTLSFQHIPVPEIYDNLLTLTSSSTAGAVRGTGQWSDNYYILNPNISFTGAMREGPCPSAQNEGQYTGLVSAGNCVGLFVGHDHTNDFVGTDANGITMGYAQAATLHSYNLGDPAIRVFHVKADGTYTTDNVTYSEMQVEDAEDYEHDVIAGTPTVPEKIYVGDAGNSLSQQKLGTTIQLQNVNHKTQAMYTNDLEVTIDLANTVSDVTLTPSSGVNVAGPTVTAKDDTTNTYTWMITGGTATAGTDIEYKISYTHNGATLTQYAYSYVDDIPTPAGYYFFTRNYRGGNNSDNFNTQTYVMTVLGDTVYGDTRTTTDSSLVSVYDGENIGSWENAAVGYYNYLGSDDSGFANMSNTNYGLTFVSPARARAHYDFPRFMEAGKSPVATVYADTSEVSTLNDLGLYVNYWRHMAPDNGLTTTMKLYFKYGDSSYTTTNLEENTVGVASINTNVTEVTLANAKASNASFKINGTLPANGTQYTMISHGYSHINADYDTPHNTYAPILLSFVTYTKADLRALVNAERTAMRQTDSITYRSAFENAYKVLQKTNTTQSEIDGAKVVLESAIEALTFTGDNISDNAQYAGASTVAPIIYVAGDGYGVNKQPQGNTIVSGLVNFGTASLNTQYSKFTFEVPQGATDASVTAVTSGGNTVSLDYISGEGKLEGTVIGGTAYEGEYIKYTFTYTLNGLEYYQTEASAVLAAPQAAGWAMYVRRGGMNIRNIVETSVMFADVAALPAGAYYTGTKGDASELTSVNFSGTDFSSQQGLGGTGMNVWTGLVDGVEDRIYGNDDDVWDDTSRDGGYRARLRIDLDTSVISDLGSIGMGVRYQGLQSASATGAIKSTSDLFLCDAVFFGGNVNLGYIKDTANQATDTNQIAIGAFTNSAGGTEAAGSVDGTGYIARYGTKEENDPYLIASLYSPAGIPAAGDYTYWTQVMEWNDAWSNNKLFAHALWSITVNHVNKSAIRNIVAAEDELYRQLSDGYSDANGTWTAYVNALAKAKAAVTNVTMNDAETANVQAELNAAIAALEYLPADYTEVLAKIDEVRIQNADNSYSYRPNKNMDPTYYATGNYYPWNNFSSTNEVDIPIDNINWNLDIRYQSTVDGYVDAIDIGWANVTLASANYTVVDRYLSYKTGHGENGAAGGSGIKLPQKYAYLMITDFVDYENFTSATYQDWTDACAAGMSNRTLKAPDQAQVDAYAADLETTYNALELNGADYSGLDEIIGEIELNINETVEVVDPSNSANNYTIPYYSPEYIATLEAKIEEYEAGLNVLEQDEIDQLAAELEELYAHIGENLNDADYTFANEQKAIEATYEAEAEKYYTADSWQALVDARAAVKSGKLSGEQSIVNGYAKAIYDARNALVYNGADYSVVKEYQTKYEELLPTKDWYNNWAAFESAYNAVVEGKDVTQQAEVDTMANNLKAAYDALEKKLADYTALQTQISNAEAKMDNQMFYTEDTYSTFYAEYLEAKEFKAKDALTIDQQATVDGYTAELEAAIKALEWKPADMDPITTALDSYYMVDIGSYEVEYPTDTDGDGIVDVLEAVYAAAMVGEDLVAKNEADQLDIRNNSEIIAAANTLNTEIAALPALYSMVDQAIADIPEDLSIYTAESVNNLNLEVAKVNRNLKIGDQETVDNYAYAIWEAIDNLQPSTLELVAAAGTTTVIDNERGFIYGLVDADIAAINDVVTDGWAEVVGNGHVECTPVAGQTTLGTGAKVELISDYDGEVKATYYIVIFGDNNGDGYYDGYDTTDLVNWLAWNDCVYDYEDMTAAQVFAMDINADGAADGYDIFYITEYLAWNIDGIKQTYEGQA